jgi:hypothetical protein
MVALVGPDPALGLRRAACAAMRLAAPTVQYRVPADYSNNIGRFGMFWMPAKPMHNESA